MLRSIKGYWKAGSQVGCHLVSNKLFQLQRFVDVLLPQMVSFDLVAKYFERLDTLGHLIFDIL